MFSQVASVYRSLPAVTTSVTNAATTRSCAAIQSQPLYIPQSYASMDGHTTPPHTNLVSAMPSLQQPHASDTTQHFVFGYGSLINPASRLRTFGEPTDGLPVSVRGLRRSWSYRCSRRDYTAVAVERSHNRNFITNGVLIPIRNPAVDLPRLDDREKDYIRSTIPLSDIDFYSDAHRLQLIPQKETEDHRIVIWLYECPASAGTTDRKHTPCIHCPIPQSYIDCMMAGCLQFGLDFARQFVASTYGWEGPWLDDRFACTSVRKYVNRIDVGEVFLDETQRIVDRLLGGLLPTQYATRLRFTTAQ
ncbi:hypothetical protein BASA62_003732 [Batrachochytrium salamandrivorans]|nr:hypothetical protein BASA62_003732 [Batrachochytrium salamandrivorans]